ncbi:MAG: Ku protein [Reyranellaceae bacterium]
MPARPSWQGHLRLSLVTCPVALYPATSEAETIRFNLINPQTNNRIRMLTVDAGTGEEVSRGALVKGFAVAKDEYVLLDREDLEAIKLESTRRIDIERFVPRAGIDRLYWDVPYHLVPSGKTGIEAFAVIREAMEQQGMVALGRLVMSSRERICALEVEADALLLTTLRRSDEVRSIADVNPIDLPKADPAMLEIARRIIEQQAGQFDPAAFHDRYEEALRQLIEEKRKGLPVRPAAVPESSGNVIDLMQALRNSLQGAERAPAAPTAVAARRRGSKAPSESRGAPAAPRRKRGAGR